MIDAIRRFLTVRYNYANPLARQRAGGLVVINTIMLVTWSIYIIVFVVPGLLRGEIPAPTVLIPLITLPILGVFTYYFVQNGRLGLAIWLFLIVLYLGIVPFSVFSFNYNLPIFLLIPTVAAGVLLDRRNFMVMLLLLLGALFVRVNVQNGITETIILDPSQNAQFDFGLMLFAIALPAAFLYAFSGSTQRISAVSVDDIHHLRAIGTFAEIEEDEDSLLANALRVVQSELGYEVGQIFLVGEDGIAQRRIRLGIGLNELTSSPVINLGNANVIRDVFTSRQYAVVTTQDDQPRRSHLAVSSQRALAVPIIDANRVIGVLDVQTSSEQSFSANQIEAFRLLGQRLGEALTQSRLVNELRRSLREREEAAAYMRAQLAEMQGRDRQSLISGWSKYLQSRGELIGYDLQSQSGNVVAAGDLPQEIRMALEGGDVFVESRGEEQIINAPIIFRGEVLGAMSFSVPTERPISERELEMVRTVANRLGVALENNRLLEQTQAQAQRERKASEVANVLLTATNIEMLMELAAENFNDALDAIYTRIYLEPGVVLEPPATRGEPA